MALVNKLIGHFGKYHLWLCCIVFISKFGVAFQQMAIIFLAPPARYKCPGNKTCCHNPTYDKSTFTKTIITEWNLICKDAWLSDLHHMMFQFGILIGSLLFGITADKYGRKPTLIFAVVLEVFSGIMASFLPDFWSFTILRMIVGMAVGGVMVIGFVVIIEYVGSKYRGIVSVLFHVPFTLGHILLALIGYLIRDYSHLQLVTSLSNIVLLPYICFLPETPRWLLAVNKTVKAIDLMKRVAKRNGLPTEEISRTMELDQMNNIRARNKKGTVIDLFRKPNTRRNMLVMSFLWLSCSYCFYGMVHYISNMAGIVFINVTTCGTISLCACFLSIPIVRFLKRKTLIILLNSLSSISFFVMIFVPEGLWSNITNCIGCLWSFMTFIAIYLYAAELFPTIIRAAAIGIASMMARFGAMAGPFAASLKPQGKWCTPVAFGIMPLIAGLLSMLLPETKDCELMTSLEEAEELVTDPSEPSSKGSWWAKLSNKVYNK